MEEKKELTHVALSRDVHMAQQHLTLHEIRTHQDRPPTDHYGQSNKCIVWHSLNPLKSMHSNRSAEHPKLYIAIPLPIKWAPEQATDPVIPT